MIAIIDYGMGNLKNIYKALKFVGAECQITSDPQFILNADGVVLPGVGAFQEAMRCITSKGINGAIKTSVNMEKPFLGICLGLQLLFDKSYEGGENKGLSIVDGYVKLIDGSVKIPHMGWNKISIKLKDDPLFYGVDNPIVYFVHSYCCVPKQAEIVTSTADYGESITASIMNMNLFGVQFHPEKSGECGIKILDNFRRMVK